MDNYLKENRNGIEYKEILFLCLGRLDLARLVVHPILGQAPNIDRFFS